MPNGTEVLLMLPALEAVLQGHGSPLSPVPADDVRETALLTTTLRVGDDIDDDVAVVVSTSGTTGAPKGAMLTAAALQASATATHSRLGGPGRWLLPLPAHHIAGLQVLIRSVLAGTTPVVIPPTFDAAVLPQAVAALGNGRRYTSMAAAQLVRVLAHKEAAAALAHLDAVLIGGGPLPAVVAEKASAAGIPVVRTYGMSETAGGCIYEGLPLDGVRVRIDDGHVTLGGATLAKGYRNRPTPDPFRDHGWFHSHDAGSIDAFGVLTVHGRLDGAISTGGLTVLPEPVEAALATHPVVAACAVFGLPDDRLGQRVAAAVVLVPGSTAPSLKEVRQHVAASLDRTAAPRQLFVVDALPMRGIGKVDRRALAQRFNQ